MILDEPTSVLTPQEAESLFAHPRPAQGRGPGAALHLPPARRRPAPVRARHRSCAAARSWAPATPAPRRPARWRRRWWGAQIAEVSARGATPGSAERFAAVGLSLPAPDLHATALKDIDLAVRGGEVLGIAGVAGNGQDELFAALSGERLAAAPGQIVIDGAPAGRDGGHGPPAPGRGLRPGGAQRPRGRAGLRAQRQPRPVAPRHRRGEPGRLSCSGGSPGASPSKVVESFDVRVGAPDPAARTLSGGNLQKFVVGREILREPGVLVINQPTWGVDAARRRRDPPGHPGPRGRAARPSWSSAQDLDELFRHLRPALP